MKFRKGLASAIALFVLGTLTVVLLPGSPATGAPERFRVCDADRQGYSTDIDADDDGDFSPGDYSVSVDRLQAPRDGKAGRSVATFTVVRPVPNSQFDAVFNVHAMFFFPGGKISVYASGKFSDLERTDGVDFPITGGTGRYEGVSGVVNVRNGKCNGKGSTVFVFHLLK